MRVRYFACPSATWELALARPGPRLRHAAYGYRGYRKVVEQPRRWLSLPADVVTLVVGLAAGQRLLYRELTADAGWTAYTSTVEGLSTQSWVCEAGTDLFGVEVALAPWAAFAVLGVEMRELTGAIAEPDALLGDRIHQLAGALAALPGWEQRFDLLDEVLAAWLGGGFAWSPRVAWAYNQLRQSGGTIPIDTLAERVGWRPRQLEYRFGEQVGLTPKATARVFRFRRAVRLLTGADWTPQQTAAACGFSDQPHLTREFKAITGFTPDRLRAKIRATTDTGRNKRPDRSGPSSCPRPERLVTTPRTAAPQTAARTDTGRQLPAARHRQQLSAKIPTHPLLADIDHAFDRQVRLQHTNIRGHFSRS